MTRKLKCGRYIMYTLTKIYQQATITEGVNIFTWVKLTNIGKMCI